MIRRIRDLLYDQGFTISGARNRMQELLAAEREKKRGSDLAIDSTEGEEAGLDILDVLPDAPVYGHGTAPWNPADAVTGRSAPGMASQGGGPGRDVGSSALPVGLIDAGAAALVADAPLPGVTSLQLQQVRRELSAIRDLLSGDW